MIYIKTTQNKKAHKKTAPVLLNSPRLYGQYKKELLVGNIEF